MQSRQTNLARQTNPDWSALLPVTLPAGPHRLALYRALRELIETRRLSPGSRLPPTRDLAVRLGIARGAAVAAYEMLVADGFAEARVGAGTRVAADVPALTPEPPPALPAERPPERPLPGTLGLTLEDPRTMRIFRRLVTHHLARPDPRLFAYGDPRGDRELRAAIADYLALARGVRCTPERILLTAGTQQGLDLVLRALLSPGDAVWMEDPCYQMALRALRGAGLTVCPVPVDTEGLDVAAGIARAPAARAAYVTPSHQFPTGVVLTLRRRLALADWAAHTGAWIIEDDYDSEFRHAGAPLTSLQGISAADRVIYLGSFSKILFPGLRLGYLVLPAALVEPVTALRARVDRFPPSLLEPAMTEFLAAGHLSAHLRRARRTALAARDALVAGLAEAGLSVRPPDQGLHLIAGLPEGVSDRATLPVLHAAGLGARALSEFCIETPARSGLVIGFGGVTAATLTEITRRLAGTDWRTLPAG